MGEFNGDPDFYRSDNPIYEVDNDEPKIYSCIFCGEIITESEEKWLRPHKMICDKKPCCEPCYEYNSTEHPDLLEPREPDNQSPSGDQRDYLTNFNI